MIPQHIDAAVLLNETINALEDRFQMPPDPYPDPDDMSRNRWVWRRDCIELRVWAGDDWDEGPTVICEIFTPREQLGVTTLARPLRDHVEPQRLAKWTSEALDDVVRLFNRIALIEGASFR